MNIYNNYIYFIQNIEDFGQEYSNINYTVEVASIVEEENMPTINPCAALRVLKNAILYNNYPISDSPLVSPTLDKSNVVELLGYDPGKQKVQTTILTTEHSLPISATSKVLVCLE